MRLFAPDYSTLSGPHRHPPGQSFHRVVSTWEQRGYIEVIRTRNPFFWWGEIGNVLLYNWPTLHQLKPGNEYRVGLFANAEMPANGHVNKRWIFWPRRPDIVEEMSKVKSSRRVHQCVFLGGYDNPVQRGYRWLDYWRPALDVCGDHFTEFEYLHVISRARYGLCLRGYGPKCHREVECMAMGCVPIVTDGVSLDYAEPLEVGRHVLKARSVEDVREIVERTSQAEWKQLSWQGRDWFHRNCSIEGAFHTTRRLTEGL